jgi:hypothetical protein
MSPKSGVGGSCGVSANEYGCTQEFHNGMFLNVEEQAEDFLLPVSYSLLIGSVFCGAMTMLSRTKVLGSCVPYTIRPKDDGTMHDESRP